MAALLVVRPWPAPVLGQEQGQPAARPGQVVGIRVDSQQDRIAGDPGIEPIDEGLEEGHATGRLVDRGRVDVRRGPLVQDGQAARRIAQRDRCQDLPSVWVDGAKTISTACISRIERAPRAAIDWRSAPTRFSEPSVTLAGPNRIRSSEPSVPTLIRVPRGRVAEGAAMPQFVPRPGASAGAGQGRADHQGVGAGGDRLGQLAAPAHAAVGDHRDVAARLGGSRRHGPRQHR